MEYYEPAMEEFYEVYWECTNCKASGTLEIPRGTKVIDFSEATECPECGCMLFDVEDLEFK